jgi:hypothetical protein
MINVETRDTSLWDGSSYCRWQRWDYLLTCDVVNGTIWLHAVSDHKRSQRLIVDCCDHARTSPHMSGRFLGQPSARISSVGPTSLSASHSGPWPLADTMALGPHGCGRDDAARVVRSGLIRGPVRSTVVTRSGRPPDTPHAVPWLVSRPYRQTA